MEYVSTIVENQFPANIRENGQDLIAFVKAYYDWMEQSEVNLGDVTDVDLTLDQFVQEFMNTVAPSIPNWAAVDKRLLMKNIHDLWVSKGNEQSIAIMFRILFDEEIELYYPKTDILRASDGRWVAEVSVRLAAPFVGDPDLLEGELIFGTTSGAGARVERIITTLERGITVKELYISGLVGEFIDGEVVHNTTNTISGVVINTIGPLAGITIIKGGAHHQVDDILPVVQSGGDNGIVRVRQVTDRSAVDADLINGGSGYRLGHTITSFNGGSGQEAAFVVTSLSDLEWLTICTDIIFPMRNVTVDTMATFVSAGANTAIIPPKLSLANHTTTLQDGLDFNVVQTGTIASISQAPGYGSHGYGYSTLPYSATAVDIDVQTGHIDDLINGGIKGENANITVNRAPGAIVSVSVESQGTTYTKAETALITNTRVDPDTGHAAESATIIPNISGTIHYPGRYIDTQGWLSWNNKLQDGHYYQDFSYVIKSSRFVNDFRDVIKKTVHPAGVMMFGEYSIREDMDGDGLNISSDPMTCSFTGSDITQSTIFTETIDREWSEVHNADLCLYAEDILLNEVTYGANPANYTYLWPSFAAAGDSTTIQDALTEPTYIHDLTESPGYVSLIQGTNVVNGVGTVDFTTMNISTANTYVILDSIPTDNRLQMFQVTGIANTSSLTIDTAYTQTSITSGKILYYQV